MAEIILRVLGEDAALRAYYASAIEGTFSHELGIGEVVVLQATRDVEGVLGARCADLTRQVERFQQVFEEASAEYTARHEQDLTNLRAQLAREYQVLAERATLQLGEARALGEKNKALKADVKRLEELVTSLERDRGELRVAITEREIQLERTTREAVAQAEELAGLRKESSALRDELGLYVEEVNRLQGIVGEKDRLRVDAIRTLADAERAMKPLLTAIESLRVAVSPSSDASSKQPSMELLTELRDMYRERSAALIERAEQCREVIDPLERMLGDNEKIAAHNKLQTVQAEQVNLLRRLEGPRRDYEELTRLMNTLAIAEEAVDAQLNALLVLAKPLSEEILAGPDAMLSAAAHPVTSPVESVPVISPVSSTETDIFEQRAQAIGLSLPAYLTVCLLDCVPYMRGGIGRLFMAARMAGLTKLSPTDQEVDGGDLTKNAVLSRYISYTPSPPAALRRNYGRTRASWENSLTEEQRAQFLAAYEEGAARLSRRGERAA